MKCENCSSLIIEKYGSGRFCSCKCARGFSTKNKRSEISQKVSKSMEVSGYKKSNVQKICVVCGKEFSIKYKKRDQEVCSLSCSAKLVWSSEERRKNMSLIICERNGKGNFSNTFNNIRSSFNFNGIDIRCDSLLEKRGLIEICKLYKVLSIERSKIYLEYIFCGKSRFFNPDFYIVTTEGNILMECKTRISQNKTKKEHRPLYFMTISEKKEVLKKYSIENNLIPIWYDGNKIKKEEVVSSNLAWGT